MKVIQAGHEHISLEDNPTVAWKTGEYTSGNLAAASSGLTLGNTMQLSPFTQLAGVARLCLAVSCRESIVRMICLAGYSPEKPKKETVVSRSQLNWIKIYSHV